MGEFHPNQLALLRWGKEHPYSVLEIKFQDGIPMSALTPTEDGLGKENIIFAKVAEKYGLTDRRGGKR